MSVSSGSASQVISSLSQTIVYTVSVVAVSDLPSVQTEAVLGTHRYRYNVLPLLNFTSVPVIIIIYCMFYFRSLC